MLRLIGFEFKNIWRRIALYCLVVGIFTLATVYLWGDSFEGFFNDVNFYWVTIFRLGALGVTGAVCFICLILTFIALTQWFGQNLLAEEGHFMHMLPVSKVKLYLSKTVCALVVNLWVVGFMLLCVWAFLLFGNRLPMINDVILDLMGEEGGSFHMGLVLFQLGLVLLCHCTSVTLLAFTSLCMGQFVYLGRNMIVFLAFIGIGLAQLVIDVALGVALGVVDISSMNGIQEMISGFGTACYKLSAVFLVNCLISFGLGSYVLSTRLNLD